MPRVIQYFKSGKLVPWLQDRGEDDLAEQVAVLQAEGEELPQKLCAIFNVLYDETIVEEVKREGRLARLKEYSEDEAIRKDIDSVAFDQEELHDLLDKGTRVIYLCGERFTIPLSMPGVTYIGVNKPVAVIGSCTAVDWESKQLILKNVIFAEEYQAVAGAATPKERQGGDRTKVVEVVKDLTECIKKIMETYR